jgi:biopolymer transport protein ExbB/biopolymer transport protein TolQ
MNMSLMELWDSMQGFARSVVYVLAFMSVYSLGVAGAKWWRIRKSMKQTAKFAPEFARFLQEDQLDQAIALAEKQKVSHVARVLGEALTEIRPLIRNKSQVTAGDINSAERAVERQMLILLSELKRGLAVLATVGATAPFVGLLGTVMGIVNAFTPWR